MPIKDQLARLYDEHAEALFAFLLNLTRNEADTRDLLQEIFIKVTREGGLGSQIRNERQFLFRLARNLFIDHLRSQSAHRRRNDAFQTEVVSLFAPAASPDEQAFSAALSAALGELPIEQREVVHMKLWSGLTFEAIAELLEIPLNTAASRYRYGIDKMRERLRPLYEEIR